MLQTENSARGVATIVLDRPAIGNCYNDAMMSGLRQHLVAFAEDPKVRILVIRGAGRHFCVGADIGWHQANQAGPADHQAPSLIALLRMLDRFPKPTVAVVHGACIGGGAAIVACCDVVLAERQAFFSIPEVRLGLAAASLVPIFIRAMGQRQFRRYGLTAERFSAEEAARIGFVHVVYDDGEAGERLRLILDSLLLGGPGAQARTKTLALRYGLPDEDDRVLEELEAGFHDALYAPEAVEGIASFVEKRKPAWYPDG